MSHISWSISVLESSQLSKLNSMEEKNKHVTCHILKTLLLALHANKHYSITRKIFKNGNRNNCHLSYRVEQIIQFSLETQPRWLGCDGISKTPPILNGLETPLMQHRWSIPVWNVAGGFCQHLQDSALRCSQILPPVQPQHTSHEPTCQDRREEKEINMHWAKARRCFGV